MPDAFLRSVWGEALPSAGAYGVAVCFPPTDPRRRQKLEQPWSRPSTVALDKLGVTI